MPFTALAADFGLVADTLWSAGAALAQGARYSAASEIEVEVAAGEDAVAIAAPAWRSLEHAGGAATAFQSLAVAQRLAQAHLRRGEIPRIAIVRDAGRPCVVFPTVVSRWSGIPVIRFLGDPLIQYGDVVARHDVAPAAIEAAWQAAAAPSFARFALLRRVRADARIAPLLAATAQMVAEQQAPFIDTGQPAACGPRDLRELRRLRRRLAERGAVRFEILDRPETPAAVREALDIKRDWLTERGLSSTVIGDPHWESALLTLAGEPRGDAPLRIARLTVGGRTAALEIGLVHGQRWHAFLGAVAPDFVKAGPGHVQMAETVAHCRDAGIGIYDLLAPADPYKHAVAHDAVAVRDHAVALAGGGWLAVLAARTVPALKGVARKMPLSLRRAVATWR